MPKTLDFDEFDARPGTIEASVETLQGCGGRPLPVATEYDGTAPRLTLDAAVPDGAAFGYGVVPAPDYLRCVAFTEGSALLRANTARAGEACGAAIRSRGSGVRPRAMGKLLLRREWVALRRAK